MNSKGNEHFMGIHHNYLQFLSLFNPMRNLKKSLLLLLLFLRVQTQIISYFLTEYIKLIRRSMPLLLRKESSFMLLHNAMLAGRKNNLQRCEKISFHNTIIKCILTQVQIDFREIYFTQ
jgi:hypothetical protein